MILSYFLRRRELEKALNLFYKSEFRNILIDRYIRTADGTYLLFKKPIYADGSDLYRHYIVEKDGEVYPGCPMLNRFNLLIIKKIPDGLLKRALYI